jgi:YHS domain-containing protein
VRTERKDDYAMPPVEIGRSTPAGPANDPYGRRDLNTYGPSAGADMARGAARRDVRLDDRADTFGPSRNAVTEPRRDTSAGTTIQNPHVGPSADVNRERSLAGAPSLPQGSPPLGLEGFCPVALTESTRWIKGDVRFGAIHRGRTYLFAAAADQQKFLSNPDKYSPMLSGYDAVKFQEQGQLVDGKRAHGIVHEGQMYLFSDEASLERFCQKPGAFTNTVRQAMANAASANVRR